MRRWVWRVLLAALAVVMLTVGAAAADPVIVDGFELTLNTAGTEWIVTGFDGKEEEVTIPSLYENKPVTSIADSAFVVDPANPPEKQLTKITIPGTVKTVGASAFKGSTSLNTVTFQDYINAKGDVERNATIGASAFEGCTALENLTLSSNTLRIGKDAFRDCVRLSSVMIPKFVDTIEDGAFAGCDSLRKVTFLDVATSFTTNAFNKFESMERIHCPGNSKALNIISAALGKTKTERIVHTISDVKTEATTKASCTSAGQVRVSFTCPPVVKEVPGTDADGNPITTTETTPCDTYTDGKYDVTRTTSILPHTPEPIPDTDATCTQKGTTGGTRCTICHVTLTEPAETDFAPHDYANDGEPEELFGPTCTENGLNRITKVCSVCGKSLTCYRCDELEKALEDAKDAAKEKQEALDKAIAENNQAIEDYAKASNDLKEAEDALKAANDAREKAIAGFAKAAGQETPPTTVAECESVFESIKTSYEDAQSAVQTKQTEIEDLQKDIEDLQAQLETAEEADKAGIEAQITAKQTELTTAEGAIETLKTDAAKAKEKWDAVNAAYTGLLLAQVAYENAERAKTQAATAEQTAAAAKSAAETALEAAKKNNESSSTAIGIAKTDLIGHVRKGPHKEAADAADLADDLIWGEVLPASGHKWIEPSYVKPDETNKIPDCVTGSAIILPLYHTCEVCGKEEPTGENEAITPAGKHQRPDDAAGTPKIEATCTEAGVMTYDYVCEICGATVTGEEGPIPALGHDFVPVEGEGTVIKEATCTEPGERETGRQKCTRCDATQEGTTVVIPALGHDWGEFVPDEGQDTTPNEDCQEKTVTGTVSCSRKCGVPPEERTLTIAGLGKHTWGEWKITKEPTATEEGEMTRTCSVCGKTETKTIPATGPTDPDDPDNPDNPDTPDPPEGTTFKVDVIQASGGTTTVSRSTAKEGDLVTITVSPNSGYVLDMMRVIGGSQLVSVTTLGNNQYRFTMPAANVEVRVTYDRPGSDYGSNWSNGFGNSGSGDRSDPRRTTDVMPVQIQEPVVGQAGAGGQLFQDVPVNHWAAGEINWASQMGYMSGTGSRFNPDGAISQQQVWMVLARLSGVQPANMAEARRWAELGGYADGSSPTAPVKRHQLVKALYHSARLSGRAGRTAVSLAGYPDSRLVPAGAREAFTWALTTGVISSNSEGRLKPNDPITRAQFAVILYRYSTRT